jgi:predicted enzyme related to lactoylglutathione lyase
MSEGATITGFMSANVYVADLPRALAFYRDVLGLEVAGEMGPDARFLRVGDNRWGVFLEGGYAPAAMDERSSRMAFTLRAASASAMHAKLRSAGATMIHGAPQDMGNATFWFQFRDPDGNILELIGAE